MVTHRYCTACGAANQVQDAFCFACGKPLQTATPLPQYPVAGSASSTLTGLLTSNHLLKQRYLILSQLGKGGFGAVYKAEDTQLGNRLLAVKEMSQSGLSPQEIIEAAENFKREALLLASLKHPNLPSIYDHFSEAGRWYLVMDFIEGETLEEHLSKEPEGHLSVEETLQIAIQLCTVLGYLHIRQPPIIFRDLKPANVMMTPDGHLYLIDFGIARHFKPGQARDTIAFGSPGYAAPEQYGKAQTTSRSDIYSLGATLHQLLTGIDPSQTPFQFASLQQPGQPTPPGLESLIMQMLEMNESKRPESMITIKQQLQSIAALHPNRPINALQLNVSTQPGASPSNPLPPTQTHSAGAIQHPVTPKRAGGTYLNAKRYQEALLAFEQAIQLDPNDAVIYNGKGLALSNLNRYGEALIAYEQAVQLNPGFENAYINKAYALYKLRRHPEALTACERAIQLGPNNASFYNLKGLILSDLNRYGEALAAYEQAIRLDPNITTAYNNKSSLLYSLKRYQEAIVSCEQAIRVDPRNAAMHNSKGNILLALKRYGEALAAYEQAIRLDPRYALAYSNKGNVLCILKRYWEALATCERAIRLDLNLASAYNNKGVALCGLKRYGEAVGACDQAILLDPNLAVAYRNRGSALQALRRLKEAQQAFKMARQHGYRG
jgi:serine/threonine protein kinase